MPYTNVWEKGGIYWEASGTVTTREIDDAGAKFYSDPRSDSIKYFRG